MPQPPLLCEEGNAKDSSRYAHLQNPCQPCPDRTTVFLHEQIQTEEKDFPAEISEGNWGGARGCDGSAENRSTNASWCCRGCGTSVDDTGYRKWDRAAHRDRRPLDAGRASPRSPRLDRDQDRLRPRRMWSLHGVARRQACLLVQQSSRVGGWPLRRNSGRSCAERGPRSAAAGLYRSRCSAMRLLHVRSAHERERTLDAQSAAERGRGTRRHDRKSLPLRRLQPLRRSGVGCRHAQRKPARSASPAGRSLRRRAQPQGRRFAMRRQNSTSVTPLKTVGHATPRIDALERVTGKATYTNDIQLPGMLYARILRSPHPHARIRRIDVSKALAVPGVKTILTRENCQVVWGAGGISGGLQYNDDIKKITRQRRYVFNNPVRFVGEPVAAVAAVNRHVAEEAVRLIQVDYEVLSFVLEPEEALKQDAVKIWPEGNLSLNTQNQAQPVTTRRGDVTEGFQASDQIFE